MKVKMPRKFSSPGMWPKNQAKRYSTAALRELHEETGYKGDNITIESVSDALVKDPG